MLKLAEPIRLAPTLEGTMKQLLTSVKENGFDGLVAKLKDSAYEPGLRTGAWRKMRVNVGQEFVIGGYESNVAAESVELSDYEGRLLSLAQFHGGEQLETILMALTAFDPVNSAIGAVLPRKRRTISFCAAIPNPLSPCCVVETRKYATASIVLLVISNSEHYSRKISKRQT